MINNDSLDSFEFDKLYGHDLDILYNDLSMKMEKKLIDLKVNSNTITLKLVETLKIMDSENFCSKIIGEKRYDSGNTSQPKYDTP